MHWQSTNDINLIRFSYVIFHTNKETSTMLNANSDNLEVQSDAELAQVRRHQEEVWHQKCAEILEAQEKEWARIDAAEMNDRDFARGLHLYVELMHGDDPAFRDNVKAEWMNDRAGPGARRLFSGRKFCNANAENGLKLDAALYKANGDWTRLRPLLALYSDLQLQEVAERWKALRTRS